LREEHPSGAKALFMLNGLIGTLRQAQGRLEVVPFHTMTFTTMLRSNTP
jgi:hypothetical protein